MHDEHDHDHDHDHDEEHDHDHGPQREHTLNKKPIKDDRESNQPANKEHSMGGSALGGKQLTDEDGLQEPGTRNQKPETDEPPLNPKHETRNPKQISDWQKLQTKLKERFGGETDFDAILFLIGLQELGKPFKKYKKDQKLEVMHVAICTLLEPFGFYEFMGRDPDGWPHWQLKENLPHLDAKQQNKLIIDAIIDYFKKEELI